MRRLVRDHHELVPEPLRPLSRRAGRWFRRAEHALRNLRSTPREAPIFVLGNQKSGTSAIAGLLGQACGLEVSLDMLQEIWRPTFHRVVSGEIPFERYRRKNRWEFSHEIVKEPNLTLLHPQLVAAFPAARFVFIVRDPRDNLRSLLNSLSIPGDLPALEPRQVSALNPGWKLVLDSSWLGVEGDHYIDQLAGRWRHFARIYLRSRDGFVLCRYEDFMADKHAELVRLAGALGLRIEHDVSADLDRPFQPPGDRSVSWRDFFGPQHLARIEGICGAEMAELGYPPCSDPGPRTD